MPVHRSPEERRALVLDWLVSDLTAGEFADYRGVSISSMYRWRRQLDGDEDPPVAFVELVATPETPPTPNVEPFLIELRVEGATVVVRSGVDDRTRATAVGAAPVPAATRPPRNGIPRSDHLAHARKIATMARQSIPRVGPLHASERDRAEKQEV